MDIYRLLLINKTANKAVKSIIDNRKLKACLQKCRHCERHCVIKQPIFNDYMMCTKCVRSYGRCYGIVDKDAGIKKYFLEKGTIKRWIEAGRLPFEIVYNKKKGCIYISTESLYQLVLEMFGDKQGLRTHLRIENQRRNHEEIALQEEMEKEQNLMMMLWVIANPKTETETESQKLLHFDAYNDISDMAMQRRLNLLTAALQLRGLDLPRNSIICSNYIDNSSKYTLEQVVAKVDEAHILQYHTTYDNDRTTSRHFLEMFQLASRNSNAFDISPVHCLCGRTIKVNGFK